MPGVKTGLTLFLTLVIGVYLGILVLAGAGCNNIPNSSSRCASNWYFSSTEESLCASSPGFFFMNTYFFSVQGLIKPRVFPPTHLWCQSIFLIQRCLYISEKHIKSLVVQLRVVRLSFSGIAHTFQHLHIFLYPSDFSFLLTPHRAKIVHSSGMQSSALFFPGQRKYLIDDGTSFVFC